MKGCHMVPLWAKRGQKTKCGLPLDGSVGIRMSANWGNITCSKCWAKRPKRMKNTEKQALVKEIEDTKKTLRQLESRLLKIM